MGQRWIGAAVRKSSRLSTCFDTGSTLSRLVRVMVRRPLLARRFSTLDHLTRGRVGWNIVTGYLDSAARAMGLDAQLAHDERYDRADEYLEVLYKLWEGSWRDDAVLRDKAARVFADPARVRKVSHQGRYYKVDGYHLSEPSRQRTPVLFQAGSSGRGQRFAARHASRVQTLTLIGTPPPQREHKPGVLPAWLKKIEEEGVANWAASTMGARLGSHFPQEGVQWWAQQLMGRTAQSTALGFVGSIPNWDVAADLPRIACPTLVITTEGSALGTVQDTQRWQSQIPNSRLLALPGDSFHTAATDAEQCAKAMLDFARGARQT